MVFRLTGDDTQIYLTKDTCKPQSARAPAARTRGTAMRHIDLRFCEGIVSHFFGVIGSPQCKSLKTLEFEACRASIVSESCLSHRHDDNHFSNDEMAG